MGGGGEFAEPTPVYLQKTLNYIKATKSTVPFQQAKVSGVSSLLPEGLLTSARR